MATTELQEDVDFKNKLLLMLQQYLEVKVEWPSDGTVTVSLYFDKKYIDSHTDYYSRF